MAPRSDAAQEEALAMAFVAVGWNTASRGPAIREGGAAAELPIPEARLTRVNAAQAAAVESKTGSRVYKFAGLDLTLPLEAPAYRLSSRPCRHTPRSRCLQGDATLRSALRSKIPYRNLGKPGLLRSITGQHAETPRGRGKQNSHRHQVL
jgi:hypothetical protein